MQILHIDGMDQEDSDLKNYIDQISGFNTDEIVTVIIDSNGGNTYIAEYLGRVIQKFKYDIEVYTANSCALTLLDKIHEKADCVYVGNTCFAIAHFSAYSIQMNNGVPRGKNERYKIDNKDGTEEYIPGVLNEEQIKEFKSGEDVYIVSKQMREYYSK